jgi:hypothetical protein
MQLEVVHALLSVESSGAREGHQSVRCNVRMRRRIAAGRELALMWLEERGWEVVVASEIDLPLRSPLPCMNRNIGVPASSESTTRRHVGHAKATIPR